MPNPEQIDAPFWQEMVKFRVGYSVARDRERGTEYQEPVWGFGRDRRSLNLLPDGRGVVRDRQIHISGGQIYVIQQDIKSRDLA